MELAKSLRATIFTSCGIQIVLAFTFLYSVLSFKGEVFGEGLATGAAFLFAGAVAATSLPALTFATINRGLYLGLLLAVSIPLAAAGLYLFEI